MKNPSYIRGISQGIDILFISFDHKFGKDFSDFIETFGLKLSLQTLTLEICQELDQLPQPNPHFLKFNLNKKNKHKFRNPIDMVKFKVHS